LEKFRYVFVKIQGSDEFLELLNYFSIEKHVKYVYNAVDRVYDLRSTGLCGFIE
jgi:hypothetical protein